MDGEKHCCYGNAKIQNTTLKLELSDRLTCNNSNIPDPNVCNTTSVNRNNYVNRTTTYENDREKRKCDRNIHEFENTNYCWNQNNYNTMNATYCQCLNCQHPNCSQFTQYNQAISNPQPNFQQHNYAPIRNNCCVCSQQSRFNPIVSNFRKDMVEIGRLLNVMNEKLIQLYNQLHPNFNSGEFSSEMTTGCSSTQFQTPNTVFDEQPPPKVDNGSKNQICRNNNHNHNDGTVDHTICQKSTDDEFWYTMYDNDPANVMKPQESLFDSLPPYDDFTRKRTFATNLCGNNEADQSPFRGIDFQRIHDDEENSIFSTSEKNVENDDQSTNNGMVEFILSKISDMALQKNNDNGESDSDFGFDFGDDKDNKND